MKNIIFNFAMLFLLTACAAPAAEPTFQVPELRAGTVLRRSLEDETGYRTVLEGGDGPGIILTFPPLEYKEISKEALRLAGRVENGVKVRINGSPVTVYPSGTFIALLPIVSGENRFEIIAADQGGETACRLEIVRKETASPGNKVQKFKQPRQGRVTRPYTPLQLLPGRVRLLTLAEETVLKITGRTEKHFQVDLGGGLTAWVRAEAVELAGPASERPFRAGNVEIEDDQGRARFSLQTSVASRVEYISPSELKVIFYNTVVDTHSINLGDWKGTCRWSQDRDGQVVFHIMGKLDCYRWALEWDGDGYRLEWKGHPNREKKATVCIDPGHGGREWGAVSPGGIREKEINLRLAERVGELLKKKGITVVSTRDEDRTTDLCERIEFAREHSADLFISLHYNSVGEERDPLIRSGCTVFYYNPPAQAAAGELLRALTEIGLKDNGVRWRSLAVIRPTDLVAVLVEVAFLSHPEDESKILEPQFLEKTADAIVEGVLNYLNQ
ncbi:MAG: N-acetylmuramoyl-L-alanine amidase [Candidatus Euphemobacter frigidus]|nr:N-acetylmuramoyl-L-alanine amidase [Candidatus Euphemobacter frigidus]MDP8275553.1 N-acetylmuramoyl-L-alanine amidase [Candidatus Euphemobacter frigidus]